MKMEGNLQDVVSVRLWFTCIGDHMRYFKHVNVSSSWAIVVVMVIDCLYRWQVSVTEQASASWNILWPIVINQKIDLNFTLSHSKCLKVPTKKHSVAERSFCSNILLKLCFTLQTFYYVCMAEKLSSIIGHTSAATFGAIWADNDPMSELHCLRYIGMVNFK